VVGAWTGRTELCIFCSFCHNAGFVTTAVRG